MSQGVGLASCLPKTAWPPTSIGIVDQQGRFLLWNRRAEEIYGYSFQELAGKTAFDLYADSAELGRMLGRLRQDGVVREYEIAMQKKDGRSRIVAMSFCEPRSWTRVLSS